MVSKENNFMKWNDGTNLLDGWDDIIFTEWSDTLFECPEDGCDGIMQKNNMLILNPPQYKYRCKKCGKVRYRWQ